jgi:heme/copper-type cytochrome/quinol oxidase subunit 1
MNMRRVPFFTWSVLVASVVSVVALPVIIGDLLYLFAGHHYPSLSDLQANSAFASIVGFGFSQPTTILFAIPALGLLADTVATFTGQRLKPRGIIFTGIGLMGVGVFATVLQAPATIRPGFLDLDLGEQLKDVLPFALVHLLPLLGAVIALGLAAKGLAAKPKLSASYVFALFAGLNVLGAFAISALVHIGDAGLAGTVAEEAGWLCAVFAGVFAALGGVSYWAPKWWGRVLPAKATLPLALLAFLGGELASLSLLIAGFADQVGGPFPLITKATDSPVITHTYSGPAELWNWLNTLGIALVALAVLAFVALALKSFIGSGDSAGDDPYDGQTLEWATTSPAPFANFADVHIVQSAEPLLDLKPSNRSDV